MIARLAEKNSLTIVGLMSGTSMDGVDAAVCEIGGPAEAPTVREIGFVTDPYPENVLRRLRQVSSGDTHSAAEFCRLDHEIGEAFGRAALRVLAESSIPREQVDLVASHGQTIHHEPFRRETWQLGEPSRIAAAVRAPVVSDFRRADQAVGGHGAPLVPLFDALLLRHQKRNRVLLNIGGIANLTVLPAGHGSEGVFAFDTGPGNVLIDEFVARATDGRRRLDEDGRLAAAGEIDMDLLSGFLEHPYFLEEPPKSTGRETFGAPFVALTLAEWARRGDRIEDVVATLTEFTALSITESIREYVLPHVAVDEVLVSGGGVHNATLMARMRADLDLPFDSLQAAGFSPDAKEALAFALLGRETICGRAGNVPGATGAREAVPLGNVTLPPGWRP
ncbi:MAG: anhydro-N-acetylmuramic acid kinase [bacterium]